MTIKSSQTLVAEALEKIKTISPDEAHKKFNEKKCNLIDIRDIRELEKQGRVEGANHIPRGMLEFWIDTESPYHKDVFVSGKTLILYCASAWRSALATKALQDMGVPNVAHMEGGFSAWKERKLPIDTVSKH